MPWRRGLETGWRYRGGRLFAACTSLGLLAACCDQRLRAACRLHAACSSTQPHSYLLAQRSFERSGSIQIPCSSAMDCAGFFVVICTVACLIFATQMAGVWCILSFVPSV